MRKIFLSVLGMMSLLCASAQFSAGAAYNYTMYKQNFRESTPGIHVRGGYLLSDRFSIVASYTHALTVKEPFFMNIYDGYGNFAGGVESQERYHFKTISLQGLYNFIGTEKTLGSVYATVGGGLILLHMKERITGDLHQGFFAYREVETENESSMAVNFGLGGQYKLAGDYKCGTPAIFGEVLMSYPTNEANGQYIQNAISINVGFKFTFDTHVPKG